MDIENNKDSTHRVWLTQQDIDTLLKHCTYRQLVACSLGAKAGLRSKEITQVQPRDITTSNNNTHYLTIREGKDTTGEKGGKRRKTIIPESTHSDISRYCMEEGIQQDEQIIKVTPRRLREVIKNAVRETADSTNNKDWLKVSSHDLRRSWGHHLLVSRGMNPRVVMALGGWANYKTMERYLHKATERELEQEWNRVMR